MATIFPAQTQSFIVAGSGQVIGDTQMTFTQMLTIGIGGASGVPLTMASLGTLCYMTIEPNTVNEEQIQFTGLTQNSNGTATITGVSNVNNLTPYTVTSGFLTTHAGGITGIITNTSAFYAGFANVNDVETISGLWTFSTSPIVPTPTTAAQAANKSYVDGVAIAGAPDSSTTVKGIGRVSVAPVTATIPIFVGDNDSRVPTTSQTAALVGNNTSIAVGSGNKFVTQTGLQNKAETYATSTGSANAYVLTLSPVPTAYVAGQEFEFKANFSNTGTSTLNVNSLGAKTINKLDGATALASGDIINGQVVKVKYDGTNFQMISPVGTYQTPLIARGTLTISTSTSTAVTTTFLPKVIRVWATGNGSTTNGTSYGGWDAVLGNSCVAASSTTQNGIQSTAYFISYSNNANSNFATIGSVTSTGFTFTSTVAGGNVAILLWEAQQ